MSITSRSDDSDMDYLNLVAGKHTLQLQLKQAQAAKAHGGKHCKAKSAPERERRSEKIKREKERINEEREVSDSELGIYTPL